jgi:hypothetical protein
MESQERDLGGATVDSFMIRGCGVFCVAELGVLGEGKTQIRGVQFLIPVYIKRLGSCCANF